MDTSLIKWTHYFEYVPDIAVSRCIIIKERKYKWIGFLFGDKKILDVDGYIGWVSDKCLFLTNVNDNEKSTVFNM